VAVRICAIINIDEINTLFPLAVREVQLVNTA